MIRPVETGFLDVYEFDVMYPFFEVSVWLIPVPGIPTVFLTPFGPTLIRAPGMPALIPKPLLLILTLTPLQIFTRFCNLIPIAITPFQFFFNYSAWRE